MEWIMNIFKSLTFIFRWKMAVKTELADCSSQLGQCQLSSPQTGSGIIGEIRRSSDGAVDYEDDEVNFYLYLDLTTSFKSTFFRLTFAKKIDWVLSSQYSNFLLFFYLLEKRVLTFLELPPLTHTSFGVDQATSKWFAFDVDEFGWRREIRGAHSFGVQFFCKRIELWKN